MSLWICSTRYNKLMAFVLRAKTCQRRIFRSVEMLTPVECNAAHGLTLIPAANRPYDVSVTACHWVLSTFPLAQIIFMIPALVKHHTVACMVGKSALTALWCGQRYLLHHWAKEDNLENNTNIHHDRCMTSSSSFLTARILWLVCDLISLPSQKTPASLWQHS